MGKASVTPMRDLDHLRTLTTTQLSSLERRLDRSINELIDYRDQALSVIEERKDPSHDLYGVLDQGESVKR